MSDLYTLVNSSSAFGSQALRAKVTGTGTSLEDHTVSIVEETTYTLWVRALAHEASKQFYAGIQGQSVTAHTVTPTGQWVWIDCGEYALTAGVKTVVFGPKDEGVFIDTVVLTELDLTPTQIDTRLGGAPGGTIPPAGGSLTAETGLFSLEVNPAFNDSNRVLKDGTAFTSIMNEVYDGLINNYINSPVIRSGGAGDSTLQIERILGPGANSYDVGRYSFRQIVLLLIFFRLTGDIRILDELCRLAKIAYSQGMRTTWLPDSSAQPGSGYAWAREPHGGRFFVSDLLPKDAPHYGNDDHLSDTPRSMRVFAEIGWALRVNEGLTSPGGHNYATEAAKWEEQFVHYEKVWSSVDDASWPSNMRVPASYVGQFKKDQSKEYRRAPFNVWPVNTRAGTHTTHGGALLSLFAGRLQGKESVGLDGVRYVMDEFFLHESYYLNANGREHAIWKKDYSWSGDPFEAHPNVYSEYTICEVLTLYLDGAFANEGWQMERWLRGAAQSCAHWVYSGSSATNYIMKKDINGGVDRTGTSIDGDTRLVFDTPQTGDRARNVGAYWNHSVLSFLADDAGKMRAYATQSFYDYYSNAGDTFDEPELLSVPLGVFLDEAFHGGF